MGKINNFGSTTVMKTNVGGKTYNGPVTVINGKVYQDGKLVDQIDSKGEKIITQTVSNSGGKKRWGFFG